MKLTDFEISKVYGMYFGCEVIGQLRDGNAIGYLTGISGDTQSEVQFIEDGNVLEHPEYRDYEHLKLLLVPLEKITDEDAMQVANMNRFDRGDDIAKQKVGRDILNRAWVTHVPDTIVIPFDCYQFLLSKSYAVPLWFSPNHPDNGKTAIELGIAIEKPVDLKEVVW